MIRLKQLKLTAGWSVAALLLGIAGCSTDTPTAPQQQPAPGPGAPSANWVLTVTVDPDTLTANGTDPATVSVRVRRADNNQAPANGTTIVVSTSLGEFGAIGSSVTQTALSTVNGRAQVLLFPGPVVGTAVVTAQLEASAGQGSVRVLQQLAPLVAAFSFQNTTDNLSIQFLNESTGGPDSFHWDFGDGNTSSQEHPSHVYSLPGDYPVELTVFRGAESAKTAEIIRAVQDIFITGVDPRIVREGGRLRISGQGFDTAVRVLVEGVLAKLISKSSTLLVIDVPFDLPFPQEPCDSNGDGSEDGLIDVQIDPPVNISVEVSGSVGADTVPVGLTILPDRPRCEPGPSDGGDSGNLFVTQVSPNAGPDTGGQLVTLTGSGFLDPLRVFFGGGLATTQSVSPSEVVVITPPGVLATASCDLDNDGTAGQIEIDTQVNVDVELASGTTHTAPGAYTYLAPIGAPCVGD